VGNRKTLVALIALLFPVAVLAQQAQSQRTPNKRTSAERGKDLFLEFCASCHGVSGKGDGPVAPSLKTPPADLTVLATHNKGQFPSLKVMEAINAGPSVPAHGSEVMPVWGPIFLRGESADAEAPPQTPAGVVEQSEHPVRHGSTEAEVKLRIYNLMEYIRTLQSK
jgi:mono/diheme cytochrome c family protein